VEIGDWRNGQADDDRPRPYDASAASGAEGAAGATRARPDTASADSDTSDAPNLWVDDPINAWGSTPSWLPQPRKGEDHPTGERVLLQPDGWYHPPGASEWGQPRHSASTEPGPSVGSAGSAAPLAPPTYPPASPAPAYLTQRARLSAPVAPAPVTTPDEYDPHQNSGQVSPDGDAHHRTDTDSWARTVPAQRRVMSEEEEFGQRRHDEFGDEPVYGPVLGLTTGWYGVPAAFYLVWLLTVDVDRQALAGRSLLVSLPWLMGAVVLSLAVAGLLRWSIVGWRALTISFASAVIGAGLTTIAHSLTL